MRMAKSKNLNLIKSNLNFILANCTEKETILLNYLGCENPSHYLNRSI